MEIPAWRQISSTAVPSSAWRRVKATCWSVNWDRPMARLLGQRSRA